METRNLSAQVCRLCAYHGTKEKWTYIFSDEGNQENLADIINVTLPVKVSQIDTLPKQICEVCVEKLHATHEFVLGSLAAQQELEDLFDKQEIGMCELNEKASVGREIAVMEPGHLLKDEDNQILNVVPGAPIKPFGSETENLATIKSEELHLDNVHDNDSHSPTQKYQCPLCCDGDMGACLQEPIEFAVHNKIPSVKSLEEELMALYMKANEEDDSCSSVVEDDTDSDSISEQELDIPVTNNVTDSHPLEASPLSPIKKPKRGGGRGRRKSRVAKRSKLKKGTSSRPKSVGETEDSDTLIWIKADNEQTIPLVQCIHCCGWLPGYASCLQHSLTSHIDVNETDEKTYHCTRCKSVSVSSPADLISHFKTTHCPTHDFEVEEENGQFVVTDIGPNKSSPPTEVTRDVCFFCCICEKGFSWLLDLLRHTCSQVNCNNMYCDICEQEYRNRQRFVFHMNFHSEGAPPLECDVCNESFVDDCSLYNHVRFAHSTENVECNDCGKYFRSEKGLASHQMSAHNTDPSSQNRHKCTVCGKCYRDKQGLKEHLVTHMSEKPFPCDKCDRAYNRYSRLKQHQLSHIYTDAMDCYECVNCGLAFADVEKALSHSTSEEHEVQSTTLSKIFRCEFCDTVFSCPDGLNLHRPSHVGDKPYVCHICGASFHTYSRVTTHKTTHGIYDQIEPQEGDFTIPRHFLCEHCGVSYPYWSYLQTHRKMRHSENPYSVSCKQCPEKFKNSWSVVYHRRKVHDQNGASKEWRKRTLQCPHCGVTCMYQHTLSIHIERKHGSLKDDDGKRESYQCEECGKVFKYQSSLLLHQKMHQGQKNFQCEECDKSFLTIATLRNHTKRCHQGIKPHQCEFCGKAFFHRVARDDHLRVHTGEKPFKCQCCDKRFRLKSMLTDHAKIHNDHRPYPCDVCGSSFRRMVHMKQHRMLHTGEKPFQCRFCGQDFRLKQELQRHMKTKHEESTVDTVEEDEFIFGD